MVSPVRLNDISTVHFSHLLSSSLLAPRYGDGSSSYELVFVAVVVKQSCNFFVVTVRTNMFRSYVYWTVHHLDS